MLYEIFSVHEDTVSCHLLCEAEVVEEQLSLLQEKYPKVKVWIFGTYVHFRKAGIDY